MEYQEHTQPVAGYSPYGRWIATAQQVKDTLTIVAMNLMLLVPIAWPGLVLYFLRWRLTKRTAKRGTAITLWALTFVHELLCVWLFISSKHDPDMAGMLPFEIGYIVGMMVSVAGLLEAMGSQAEQG
ncbi:hypothetical protein F0P96_05955 [Hymenobacter busanensis]|uniref:Uncharacterized protein n=1 Tax=Hymenobacter busanensis TaxID=2607656 RepID=A0A7L5A1P1_9BACT|nr:hypothetical protein [Hymenobacter busanensis]KAA9338376.1 hypothetical protein F0P96_05955 [Hymenobacter busanensis]QHJ09197.1 hypothetical protein GUY19_18650 [Hymenobacter busanensis]